MDLGWAALWGKTASPSVSGPPSLPDYSSVKWSLLSNCKKPEGWDKPVGRYKYQSEYALCLRGLLAEQSQVLQSSCASG